MIAAPTSVANPENTSTKLIGEHVVFGPINLRTIGVAKSGCAKLIESH
jgi:hypothetical protein